MASASDSTSLHFSAPLQFSGLEYEIRRARHFAEAIASLADDMTTDRETISFVAHELLRAARSVESDWDRAHEARSAH